MNESASLCESDDLTFGECVSSFVFPASSIDSHEAKNPLAKYRSLLSADITPRCAFILERPRAFTSPEILEWKEKPVNRALSTKRLLDSPESKVDSADTTKCLNTRADAEDKKGEVRFKPYQTELTPELRTNFCKLAKLKEISLHRVLKHKANLDPLSTSKKTLVLDIDGTLICTNTQNLRAEVTCNSFVKEKRGLITSLHVRPFALQLIQALSAFYEIIIFTFGTAAYANLVADYLDPDKNYIEYIFHRAHCIVEGELAVKDLRVIGGRELKDIIIIDNSVASFANNLENGIYVPSYDRRADDDELAKVMQFLVQISHVDDVRPYVREFAGICKLLEVYRQSIT
eukprot:TRINITY_DN255_c0_g4_i3.p1 TRINITY_DN255_c0_g4~~TRINITY_DN255_c0_g4_i3.p1  ORF type:complete len:345 (-),score=62.34 TRINITY_DN255_c0_g4_i3:112-1146(-)